MYRLFLRLPVHIYLILVGVCFMVMGWGLGEGTGFKKGAFTWLTTPMVMLAGASMLGLAWRRTRHWWAGSAALIVGSVVCRLADVAERVLRGGWSWPAVVTTASWMAFAVLFHLSWHYIKGWLRP